MNVECGVDGNEAEQGAGETAGKEKREGDVGNALVHVNTRDKSRRGQ